MTEPLTITVPQPGPWVSMNDREESAMKDIGPFIQSEGRIHYGDDEAAFCLMRELRQVGIVARFTVDGEPASKARPRVTRRGDKVHTYTPDKTRAAEQRVAYAFRQSRPGWKARKDITYGVCAIFFHRTNQRRDVDNMIKLVCDGLNGVAWVDDVQVEEVSGRRGYDREFPRTEVLIYEVGSNDRGKSRTCEQCGGKFPDYKSWPNKKHCSLACRMAASRDARTTQCGNCGEEFDPGSSNPSAKFCSRECNWVAKSVEIVCSDCGESFRRAKSTAAQQKNQRCAKCKAAARELRKTECVNGHLWAYHAGYRLNGTRYCRECRHESYERTKARRREVR